MNERIAFVGAGRWALSLALHFLEQGCRVSLLEPNASNLARLANTRRHPDLPDSAVLPRELVVSSQPGPVLSSADLVFFAVPSDALAAAARACAPQLPKSARAIVTVTKGIDPESLRRLSVVLSEITPAGPVVVLAGPGIPFDFASGDPTSLVAASDDTGAAESVRDTLSGGRLRIYSSPDVVGVELGAALKNVIAVAAGMSDGIGLGLNAKAALLSRGLAEMTRLGVAMSANPMTFAGLAGMGDLIVTAFSPHSRNRTLGVLLGQGRPLSQAMDSLNGIAEGAVTAHAAQRLAARFRTEMPITEEVCRVVYEGQEPKKSMYRLLRRPPKKESF